MVLEITGRKEGEKIFYERLCVGYVVMACMYAFVTDRPIRMDCIVVGIVLVLLNIARTRHQQDTKEQ